jgi:hypothetical protein
MRVAAPTTKRCRYCSASFTPGPGLVKSCAACREAMRSPTCIDCGCPRSGGDLTRKRCRPCMLEFLRRSGRLGLEAPVKRTPCTPTKAQPGSAEKIAVLTARESAGQELWHPEDGQ